MLDATAPYSLHRAPMLSRWAALYDEALRFQSFQYRTNDPVRELQNLHAALVELIIEAGQEGLLPYMPMVPSPLNDPVAFHTEMVPLIGRLMITLDLETAPRIDDRTIH